MNELIKIDLVEVKNDQLVTDSRKVAESFGKEHKNVIASIREILAADFSATRFFYETTFDNRGKEYPMFSVGVHAGVFGAIKRICNRWRGYRSGR